MATVRLAHGKASTYNNRGCRCAKCKAAWAEYLRPKQQARRRALGVPERGARTVPNGGQGDEKLGPAVTLRLTDTVAEAVRMRAERDGVTPATIMRKAIAEAVTEE